MYYQFIIHMRFYGIFSFDLNRIHSFIYMNKELHELTERFYANTPDVGQEMPDVGQEMLKSFPEHVISLPLMSSPIHYIYMYIIYI